MKEVIIKRERLSNSKILLYTLVTLIVLFIGLQLFVLTRIGSQGERVNQVKIEQNRLKIENEIKQAEVLKLQSRKEILTSIENLDMRESEVVMIDSNIKVAESNNP
jgi:Tfp pilus assembly protein PilO